jgi:hypothetical protein
VSVSALVLVGETEVRSLSSLESILGFCRIRDDKKVFAAKARTTGEGGSVEELIPMIVGPNLIKDVENDQRTDNRQDQTRRMKQSSVTRPGK